MFEVHIDNFSDLLPKIKSAINSCKFIAIDTEFTALSLNKNDEASLFDSAEVRYNKLRNTVLKTIPIQVGLSCFHFDIDSNVYTADTFTFYVWPKPILNVNHYLAFQASSFQFLSEHHFDYNMAIYQGLPFMNKTQELQLKNDLLLKNFNSNISDNRIFEDIVTNIENWFQKSAFGDSMKIEHVKELMKVNVDFKYQIQYHLRNQFNKKLWTFIDDQELWVKKVQETEFNELNSKKNLEEETLNEALGFTLVYRLIKSSKKAIVGHNLLTDLLHFYNSFEDTLPRTYKDFKQAIHKCFPVIYDSKTVSYNVRKMIDKDKVWSHGSLGEMYKYFKDYEGRHLAMKSPLIQMSGLNESDSFHDAGFDSYCTGYIFIRMAHFLAAQSYDDINRTITNTERFAAVEESKNTLNLIRNSLSSINLEGSDPKSKRPPFLVAQCKKFLDLPSITFSLSKFGYVEAKPITETSAIIAVDNYGSYKRILRSFSANNDGFSIEPYHVLKHAKYRKHILFTSGILVLLAIAVKKL